MRRIPQVFTSKIAMIAMVMALVAIPGVKLLTSSHAATPFVSAEPESGTVNSPASKLADATASGGNAVKFASGTTPTPAPTPTPTPPGQCASGGTYLWANLATCGWPDASNTGVPAGTTLTAGSTRTITAANTVIDGQNITGNITVNATGVIIRNSKISYTGNGGGGSGAIKVLAGASATITNVEINGQTAVHTCIWHEGASLTVSKVNCHDVEDGMFSWYAGSAGSGDNFNISDSYIHDLGGSESNGHLDGWQTEGAANGVLRHNTFRTTVGGSSTSIVSIWNSLKSSSNILVENNLMAGGGFAIYAEDYHPSEASPSGGNTVTKITVKDNKFSTVLGSCVGSYGVWFYRASWQPYQGGPTDGWNTTTGGSVRSGNKILETGFNLDSGNPAGCS